MQHAYREPRKKGAVDGVSLKDVSRQDGPQSKPHYKYAMRAEAARRMGRGKK